MRPPLRAAVVAGLIVSLLSAPSRASERPADVDQPFRGMYVGVDSSITSIAGSTSALLGPQVGIVAGQNVFGVAGYGLAPSAEPMQRDSTGRTMQVSLGYGVIHAGTVLLQNQPIHVIPLLLFGGGAITVAGANGTTGEAIFVVEPKLEVEIAPRRARSLRFGAQGSYRFVSAFELGGLSARDLSGPAAGGFVKLGFF
jgi:hypothetical protein